MEQVRLTPLPRTSKLWEKFAKGDFIDGYAVTSPLSAQEALQVGLALPSWAMTLLNVRNLILSPFGLKTRIDDGYADSIFPLEFQDENEVIVGTDDWHQDFRISVYKSKDTIHMSTWVHRHNLAGYIYLAAVMPFHILIVRDAMRRIARTTIAPAAQAQ
ncbi:DUF2867 domain-containing protein [Aliiroseovarius crassostreae]|uniref:DUF2867 domain-containing protein n=1 Tax=Aliiroseovarius crassostreae TaxID=154981 RepID=UPI0022077749|nr:DUF2867 domain-containing protein [Aliiroseovarius crassostreae]UWP91344.1 DUF2867 domain-containing protein [Aliiroseovarius crassostreae]